MTKENHPHLRRLYALMLSVTLAAMVAGVYMDVMAAQRFPCQSQDCIVQRLDGFIRDTDTRFDGNGARISKLEDRFDEMNAIKQRMAMVEASVESILYWAKLIVGAIALLLVKELFISSRKPQPRRKEDEEPSNE